MKHSDGNAPEDGGDTVEEEAVDDEGGFGMAVYL
jgi:hypothetical protein